MNDRHRRLVTKALAVAVLVSLVLVVYLSMTAGQSADPYTEFYVLGENGNASGYPTNMTVGESGTIIIGISNHEHQSVTYHVQLRLAGAKINSSTVTVGDGETLERPFTFTPTTTGRLRLRMLLFKSEPISSETDPYRALRLWISVSA